MSKLKVVGVGGVGALAFSYLLDDNSVNETQVNEKQNKIKSLLCNKKKKKKHESILHGSTTKGESQ